MEYFDFTINAGEDIREAITKYVLAKEWHSAYISGAIGSVKNMSFTIPTSQELPLKTQVFSIEGAAEVVSFIGEIMIREKMDPALNAVYKDTQNPLFVHIHASCAYYGGKIYGGGLAGGNALRSVRVFIIRMDK